FGDETYSFIVQRVFLAAFTATLTAAAIEATARLFDAHQNLLDVIGRAARLPGLDHPMHLVIGDESAMHTNRQAGAWRQVEHVAVAQQLLGAALIENRTRVDFARNLECHAGRDIGLDQPGDHVHGWALGSQDQVNAGGPSLLRDTRDQLFNLLADDHHHVGKFVHHYDDGWQLLQ